MPTQTFFGELLCTDNIAAILSKCQPGALLILDIDHVILRPLEPVAREERIPTLIQHYQSELDAESESAKAYTVKEKFKYAFSKGIKHFSDMQALATQVVVDPRHNIVKLANELKGKGVKVIGLTARCGTHAEALFRQLKSVGFEFSQGVVKDGGFILNDHRILVQNGIILTHEQMKGDVIIKAVEKCVFMKPLDEYTAVHFTDDKIKNCENVFKALMQFLKAVFVTQYNYVAKHLALTKEDMMVAEQQQEIYDTTNTLPTTEPIKQTEETATTATP